MRWRATTQHHLALLTSAVQALLPYILRQLRTMTAFNRATATTAGARPRHRTR